MPRRTTVLLEEEVYEKLVEKSLTKYGTAKAISKVLNELLKESLQSKEQVLRLIYSEKTARTTAKELEESRRELSERLES